MGELFLNVIYMSMAAGWLVLAVLVLRLVLHRTPKWVNVLLWVIAVSLVVCAIVGLCFLTDPPGLRTFAMKGWNVTDQYIVDLVEEGRPTSYDRTITYTPDGAGSIGGWYVHLRVQPLYEAADGSYSGQGDEVIHLFYDRGNAEGIPSGEAGSIVANYTDLNRNGIAEIIWIAEAEPDMYYELTVEENGVVLWSTGAGTPHTGWNTIMLYSEDEKDYLVQYHPTMYQGIGTYTCTAFSLEENKQTMKQQWSVEFEDYEMETPEMKQFAREVGVLLRNCYVLLSTEQGIVVVDDETTYTMAADLPQLYPVRFDPEEIGRAIRGTTGDQKLTANAKTLPEEPVEFLFSSGAGAWGTVMTLVDELPTDCRNWWPDAYLWYRGEKEMLDSWALYNVNTGDSFFA